jgi:hypothetical protein
VGGDAEKKGERHVFQLQWEVHIGTSFQTPQALSIEVSAMEERFEEFENGDTKIVDGKCDIEEVELLINYHTWTLRTRFFFKGGQMMESHVGPHFHNQVIWLWKLRAQVKSMERGVLSAVCVCGGAIYYHVEWCNLNG